MNIFSGTTIPVLSEVVQFAEARHEVLAGNVANLDTPGYKSRDLSPEVFQDRLLEFIESRKTAGGGMISPGSPVLKSTPLEALQRVREAGENILFHDGSDVGLEQQVLELSNNQFLHNMAVAILNSQFRLLQTAISERV